MFYYPPVEGVMFDEIDLLLLKNRKVRVRKGVHTFEGVLRGQSQREFPRGDKLEKGAVFEGNSFWLEFAWWDWSIERLKSSRPLVAAE
jgi:hypothetical protein